MTIKLIKSKGTKEHRLLIRKFTKELHDIVVIKYKFKVKRSNESRLDRDRRVYLIQANGEFVGMFSLTKPYAMNENDIPCKYLWRFIITEKHRSKGIGENVMKKVINEMVPNPIRMNLRVDTLNHRARKFYEEKFRFYVYYEESNALAMVSPEIE